ncbi:hypothetical protein ABKY54_004160 [Vibrio harveyi]
MPASKTQQTLSRLQSAIFFELVKHGEATGYELDQLINARGVNYSHQQVYRDCNKMQLKCVYVPQDGKPDKKVYSLLQDATYTHSTKLDVEFLLAYPDEQLIKEKIEQLENYLNSPVTSPISHIDAYRLDLSLMQLKALQNIIA